MRVVGQISPPGVQNSHHANLPSYVFWIQRQSLGSCRGGAEEDVVEQKLVTASQDSQFIWQGESQQEVGYGKQVVLLFFQPFLTFPILAFRAVPVAAGMILVLDLVTFRAGVDMPTQGFCTAAFHIPHGLPVTGQHPVSIFCAVLVSLLLEDICQLYHERSFNISLMASTAGDWAFAVKCV